MAVKLIEIGYAALRCGDVEGARRNFEQALHSMPDSPQPHLGLAIALLEQDSATEASQQLKAALEIDPDYAIAHAYLGIELLKLQEFEAAEEELEKAVRTAPTNLLVLVKFAEYYYRLGYFPRSIMILEQALKLPYCANEYVVGQARQLQAQARQKCRGMIVRETPDFRYWLCLASHLKGYRETAPAIPLAS